MYPEIQGSPFHQSMGTDGIQNRVTTPYLFRDSHHPGIPDMYPFTAGAVFTVIHFKGFRSTIPIEDLKTIQGEKIGAVFHYPEEFVLLLPPHSPSLFENYRGIREGFYEGAAQHQISTGLEGLVDLV